MSVRIVLASSSPYRRQILERTGLAFDCRSPNIDETRRDGESAEQLVKRLAKEKAVAIKNAFPKALIIGSDQIASHEGRIFGKPKDRSDAIDQLERVSGSSLMLYTGVALLNAASGRIQISMDTYQVKYRTLSTRQIENYIDQEKPFDCCGSLKVEGPGIALIESLTGDDPNTLMGLPLIQLVKMLEAEGVFLLSSEQ